MTEIALNRDHGVVRTDMHCHDCSKGFIAALNFDLDGNHMIPCPRCGHQHCRVIEKGVITAERWDSRHERIEVELHSVWASDGMKTSVACQFLRDKWLNHGRGVMVAGFFNATTSASATTTSNLTFTTTSTSGTAGNVFVPGNQFVSVSSPPVAAPPVNPREFNRYINASDLLEEFIEHMGKCGIKQGEFLNLPIEIFINWLILRAAQRDGDPVPEGVVAPENHPKAQQAKRFPRCRTCGRFITQRQAADGILWCDEKHLLIFMRRQEIKRLPAPRV